MGVVKFIGAWFCIVATVVVMVLEKNLAPGLAVPLGLLSIAFSLAPTS